jgi:hypothetical protein
MDISESDWKTFKKLRALALERFSQQILDEVQAISSKSGPTAHERYLEVYRHIHERDEEVANAFNRFSRSTALLSLRLIRSLNLLTDTELSGLSDEAQRRTEPLW